MLDRGLRWEATHIGRGGFLRGTLVTAFGLFAGLSLGKAQVVLADSCTGPYGTGQCGGGLCNGSQCGASGETYCSKVTEYCYTGTGCWSNGVGTCCDCLCDAAGYSWYCYCFGRP